MENTLDLTRERFLACNWDSDFSHNDHYGYTTIRRSLESLSKTMLDAGHTNEQKMLELLATVASMRLMPSSLNEPFKPIYEDFQLGRRSAIPEDLSSEELSFFEQILDDINEPFLKARLADILWLQGQPRKIDHAKLAIDTYCGHEINEQSWHKDINKCLERGARLARQIRDWERLEQIKGSLFAAFLKEYPDSTYMKLWLADLLDRLKIDEDLRNQIASTLYEVGNSLKNNLQYHAALAYFDLAAKKFNQCGEREKHLESLLAIAECYENEADQRITNSNLAANSFYENAIQAYRQIPVRNRAEYDVDNKIIAVRQKITSSGRASLDEMMSFSSPVDITDIVQSSITHVKGKTTCSEALAFFSGITHPAKYESLKHSAKEVLQTSILGNIFGGRHLSKDGRVTAIRPPMNLTAGEDDPANRIVLQHQILSQFSIQVEFAVQGQIIPALRQLLLEHRVTKELIIDICRQSPLVPKDRVILLGNALWLGFEDEFGLAIHLLCPQVENIVRSKLKEVGAITTHLDPDGIENENGLSTLMELPEAEQVFGKDLVFEIKCIFTEALGYNLRNNVAHGLLDDKDSTSTGSVYAWWLILRLIIRSIINGNIKTD